MKNFKALSMALMLCVSFASYTVSADDSHNLPACKGDVDQFCKDVKPGGGRIAHCLKTNSANVSAGCKQAIADAKEKFAANAKNASADCKDDIAKFCKDVKPGGGRILECLKDNQAQISPVCSSTLHSKAPTAATQSGNNAE
jgi:hypothetical protein